ncbi:DeoR family transcriptional regulator of aga operon [Chitinophaga dinghuensis]|uniref:DeoR family transcriptional regulator of aga operon n=1 Tax=Chitinophaga dinghuensis TaxID=1539050 RepID=A0A327VWC2_9BACT|nr:DeoR/GlpR family DNA-binding transcription regulator [Chitinophaga dinghuensis]RAJ80297.1 DeoR family transcriptional regulator of aga operon [Chitinophaga dinghuensis]
MSMINIAERHKYILDKLQEKGSVSVLDLCKELDVSAVTIRKDLKLLEDKSLLFRSHGGATTANPYTNDKPVNEKEHIRREEKQAIGQAAAALIDANDAIIIASGTTVQALARHIHPRGQLMVITGALNVSLELLRHPEIEVIQLGGHLRNSSSSVTGPYAERVLADFSCSKLFLGVDGIDLEFGFTTTNIMEAHLNQKMMSTAQKTIVLADSSKFGKRGFGRICGLEEVDEIITDKGIPEHVVKQLEEAGVKVTLV